MALENPKENTLDSTYKSPSLHARNSVLTQISKTICPFTLIRGQYSSLYTIFMTFAALWFVILVLMIFRFDIVGGDTVDEEINSPNKNEEEFDSLSKLAIAKKRRNRKLLVTESGQKIIKYDKYNNKQNYKKNLKEIKFQNSSDFNLKGEISKSRKCLLKTIIINFYPIFLMNYELIFFIAQSIGFGSLNCRYVWIQGGLEHNTSSGNYLQSSGLENALYQNWNVENDKLWVREKVSYLNDLTLCYSYSWYIEAFMGIIIIISNIILRVMSSRLMKFIPSFKVFACKYGNSDLIYDAFLSIIIFGRVFFINIDQDNSHEAYETIRWVSISFFWLVLIGYLIIFISRPFYNTFQ